MAPHSGVAAEIMQSSGETRTRPGWSKNFVEGCGYSLSEAFIGLFVENGVFNIQIPFSSTIFGMV